MFGKYRLSQGLPDGQMHRTGKSDPVASLYVRHWADDAAEGWIRHGAVVGNTGKTD